MVDRLHQLLDRELRVGDQPAGRHVGNNSSARSMSQPELNPVTLSTFAADAVADDDPGEADRRVLGAPHLDEALERGLADDVGTEAGPRGSGEPLTDER